MPMEEIYLACQKEFDTWDKIMKNHKPHLHPWLLPVELKINKKLIPKDIYNNIIIPYLLNPHECGNIGEDLKCCICMLNAISMNPMNHIRNNDVELCKKCNTYIEDEFK